MPKIAVLMAVYNGGEWLQPQLDSIFKQIGVDVKVFASDDMSNDGSYELLLELSQVNSRLVVLPQTGKFGSAGTNFLRLLNDVEFSTFDYVAFSDQDDIWNEIKLCSAVSKIQSNKVEGYSGNVTAFWPNGVKKLLVKSQKQQKYDYMFESAGPGCSFVFTRKLAQELSKYISLNETECEKIALHDWFTYAYARSHMFKWFIDRDSYVLYRQHQDNVLGANVGFKPRIMRWKKMREGWHRDQALLLSNLLGYENLFPIDALQDYSLCSRFKLILSVGKFRRNFLDVLTLGLFFLVTSKK